MLLDTGSSNLWVPNKNYTSATCQNHNKFNSNQSPTFKSEGNQWSILYNLGTASGVTGIDDIKIGKFTADNQTFGLADVVADNFLLTEHDGILGMASDNLNTMDNGAPTLISTLIKQKKFNPLFSFHFSHYYDFDDQGTLTLGGLSAVRLAIIDTCSTFLLIPSKDAAELHKQIPESEFDSQNNVYIIPYDTTAVVSLVFGGVEYKFYSEI
ncbi:3785_t:CDS:2 [Gigaspora rosea]|nr:3785_t:CDS:2 [Gigaspora rosea]